MGEPGTGRQGAFPSDVAMVDAFPTEHSQEGPFVMWKETPYAHLMMPVHQAPH